MNVLMQRLKPLRKMRHITQKQLAARIGYSENAVHGWEHGDYTPSCDALCKIAIVLNCSTDWLLGLTDIIEPTYSDAVDRVSRMESNSSLEKSSRL